MLLRFVLPLTLVSLNTLVLSGCVQPTPPYDASGSYTGEWSGALVEDPDNLVIGQPGDPADIACTIALELFHDVDAGFPQNSGIEGTVTFNLGCETVPEAALANITETSYTLDILGVVDQNGRLLFSSGDCTDFPCPELAMVGVGVDENNDGFLDSVEAGYLFYVQGSAELDGETPTPEDLPFATVGTLSFAVAP